MSHRSTMDHKAPKVTPILTTLFQSFQTENRGKTISNKDYIAWLERKIKSVSDLNRVLTESMTALRTKVADLEEQVKFLSSQIESVDEPEENAEVYEGEPNA